MLAFDEDLVLESQEGRVFDFTNILQRNQEREVDADAEGDKNDDPQGRDDQPFRRENPFRKAFRNFYSRK